MAIKGTDKVVVIDQSVDTTPRKSELTNAQASANTVFDLTYSEPLCKAFELVIPAIDAGAVETLTFDLGDVGNATSTVMMLYNTGITLSELENFQRAASGGGAPQKISVVGSFKTPEIVASLSSKYSVEANPLVDAVRITEDYTDARVGVQNTTYYDSGSTLFPSGFSYADYNVGSLIGWYDYFGGARGFAQTNKMVLLQSAWLEQDGANTTVKLNLINIDATANTPITWHAAFYL